MTPSQTAELLGLCAAFDRRTIGKADVLAWQTVLGDIEFDAGELRVDTGEIDGFAVARLTPDEAANLASALLQWTIGIRHGIIAAGDAK